MDVDSDALSDGFVRKLDGGPGIGGKEEGGFGSDAFGVDNEESARCGRHLDGLLSETDRCQKKADECDE